MDIKKKSWKVHEVDYVNESEVWKKFLQCIRHVNDLRIVQIS